MDRRGLFFRATLLFAAVTGPRMAAADSPADDFRVAAGHYQAQRWDLAAEGFDAFGQLYPDHALAADAVFYEAEARAQLGQFAEAAAELDQLLALGQAGKRRERAMFRRGETAYLARDYERAKPYLQSFWKEYPQHELLEYVLAYLGDVYAAAGEHAEAEAAYRACLADAPQGPLAASCRSGLARALSARGDFAEAEEILTFLAESDTPSVAEQAVLEMARLAYRQGELDAARRHCENLAARGAENEPAARLLLGEVLYRTGDLPAADEQFQRALGHASGEPIRERALYGRIRLAVDRQDDAELERLAGEFVATFERSTLAAIVQTAVGESRVARRKFEAAKEPFRAALAGTPADRVAAQCHAGLAVCGAATDDLAAAEAELAILSERHEPHWDVPATRYRVAELAYRGAHRALAARLFEQVAETTSSPELAAKALAGLAWSRLQQEDLLGSAEAFEELIEKYPNDPRAADAGLLRAQILERRGEYDAALAIYRRVIDELAGGEVLPKAVFLAARLHDRLQQLAEARILYERLLDEFPDDEHVAEARYHLGWVLRDAGEPRAAIEAWQVLHDRGSDTPRWREATYLLAEHALDENDTERAGALVALLIGDFGDGEAAADEPSTSPRAGEGLYARSLLLAAHLAMQADDWSTAREHVARLVAECPADPLHACARFWVAEAEYRLGDFDAAFDELQELQSVAAGRDDEWIAFIPLRRAQILAHRKEWREARAAAQSVIDEHPDFALRHEADYVLGRCLAAMGEFNAAREAYTRVLESETGRTAETAAMAQWMIGESYMHQQDYDAALRAYLRGEILFSYPRWQAASLLQAGKCYELMSDWTRSEATYRRLVERFPDESVSEEARARLATVTRQAARP